MLNRRDVLKSLGLVAITNSAPALALASTDGDARFILVVLRGAVDGLAIAAPYGDGNYRKLRGTLALSDPGASDGLLKLDGLFGLHPSLMNVHKSFVDGEACVIHAVASPYRERSHFDGQDVLESGAAKVGGLRDGWLNRALLPLGGGVGNETAIAMAQNTPLVLRGNNSVTSWAPSVLPDADESTLVRLQNLYSDDDFFATRLQQALRSQNIAGDDASMDGNRRRRGEAQQFSDLMQAAARFLTTPDGPSVAVIELGGWDTHANQGSASGSLANRLAMLDNGLADIRNGMGAHWSNTVIAIVTEFGRTVRVNGTRGTDHGTGAAALLLGGAVDGGRVIADWPGLGSSDLFAGRDLMPTADVRSVFKGVLSDHLKVSPAFVEREVFPDSSATRPMQDLIRS
jgi:uncharacterized protein (DUF1501 family)